MNRRDGIRRGRRVLDSARALNQHPALLHAAKRSRERVLGDDDFVDRLSTVRGRPADLAASELVALRSETPGVLGEIGMTALQAWQSLAEHHGRGRGHLDVAILFTDLSGFSTWALEAGDGPAIALLSDVSNAVEPAILRCRGEIVKRLGDGLMAAFWDASSAVEAAFAACERTGALQAQGYRPQLRAGVHVGRPRKIGGDYLGVDVNIAARLVEAAEAGEVLVSGHTLAALDPSEVSSRVRPFTAKGTPPDLGVHHVERSRVRA